MSLPPKVPNLAVASNFPLGHVCGAGYVTPSERAGPALGFLFQKQLSHIYELNALTEGVGNSVT